MYTFDTHFEGTTPAYRAQQGVRNLADGRVCVFLQADPDYANEELNLMLGVHRYTHDRPLRIWQHVARSSASAFVLASAIERRFSDLVTSASERILDDGDPCIAQVDWYNVCNTPSLSAYEQMILSHLRSAYFPLHIVDNISEGHSEMIAASLYRVLDERLATRLPTTAWLAVCNASMYEHDELSAADALLACALRNRGGLAEHTAGNRLFPADNIEIANLQYLFV